jgi:hypothetical protein
MEHGIPLIAAHGWAGSCATIIELRDRAIEFPEYGFRGEERVQRKTGVRKLSGKSHGLPQLRCELRAS